MTGSSWNTYRSTTIPASSWNTTIRTYWFTSRGTSGNTTRVTSWSTSVTTSRNTGGIGISSNIVTFCIAWGQDVHINTNETVKVETLISGSDILEMETPFNNDDIENLDTHTSPIIDSGAGLVMGEVSAAIPISSSGLVNINSGSLLITQDHRQLVKRSGSWVSKKGEDLLVGDYLYHIEGSEVEITTLELDHKNYYQVVLLDTEPNDVFFVNGFLTHNAKIKAR